MDAVSLLGPRIDTWLDQLRAMEPRRGASVMHELVACWIDGSLEPSLIANVRDVRHQLSSLVTGWQALRGELPQQEVWMTVIDAAVGRRWCWIEPWLLLSQDEDLMLMDEALIAPLLEEARHGCPKREYAISIVAHEIRDRLYGLIGDVDAMRAQLRKAEPWADLARAAQATELEAYCRRLATYAQRGPVDEAGALQRGLDLHRCSAPETLAVHREPNRWRVELSDDATHSVPLYVDRHTGDLSGGEPT